MTTPALVIATHPSEAAHWYTRLGEEAHSMPSKAGTMRPTTLRDARTLELVPSVTTIIKCAAAPGLETWRQDQMLMAALTLPRGADESEACWLDRIRNDSKEQGRAAAERGTEIHALIEMYFSGVSTVPPVDAPFLVREAPRVAIMVEEALDAKFGTDIKWYAEQSFAHPQGFGGKADLLSDITTADVLLDIKTKDNWPESNPPSGYDEHAMQLAAYRYGLGRPTAACANVFVSRQEPWQVSIHEWDDPELDRGLRMFSALLEFWQAKARYDPTWEEVVLDDIPF